MASSMKFAVLARGLSTSASSGQMVKPAVQVFGIEGRYATALYSAASKLKQLDTVERDLVKLQADIKQDPVLKELLQNPTFKRSLKASALKDVCTKVKMAPASVNLLELLAENGRLKKLDSVINAYKIIMAGHRGEVSCEVKTAKPLDDVQRKQLESTLKAFLKPKETIKLTLTVDPNLIGGMVVSIADKYVDMSIATKVKKYSEIISAPL